MGRLRIKIFIIFICCITVLFQQRKAQHLHLYFDPATTPALVQMTHFINLPPNDLKIISWNRFHNHIKNKKQFPNTDFFITDKNDFGNSSLVFQKIEKILQTKQNIHIHLHFNLLHPAIYNFLSSHPKTKDKIKSVHVYEDASGHFLRDANRDDFLTSLPKNSTLYHWGNLSKICSDNSFSRCSQIKKIKKNISLKEINFQKLAHTFTEKKRKKLFDLTGFDYEKTKKLLSGKKTYFYILGYDWQKPVIGSQLAALKYLCQPSSKTDTPKEGETSSSNQSYWFYKNHPSGLNMPRHVILDHLCPNIKSIATHLPFELLILSDLSPHNVAGFSSSLFFNLSSEQIAIYLERANDPYRNILEKNALIHPNKIWTQKKIDKHLKESNIFEFIEDDNKSSWFLKINENKMLNIFKNEEVKIIEQTKNDFVIQKNKKDIHTYQFQKDYQWLKKP